MNAIRKTFGRAVLAIAIALLVCLAAFGSGATAIDIGPPGNLQFEAEAGFAPKALHKLRFTPGALRLSNQISTVDGSHVPALKELVWEFDRNARLDVSGVPVCHRPRIAGPRPEESCGDSIVGQGRMNMEILFEESRQIKVTSPLMLYNSGSPNGVQTLFARAYITKPVASAIFLSIRLEPIHSGRFRTAMVITVPKIAGGAGSVTSLSMRLAREVRAQDQTASFVSLRCLDDRLAMRTKATFSDGTLLQVTPIQRPCAAR
jgi:hypothetical protein